jgi:mannose-6-phosphate isomerase-like protein (cupin superfamily)
MIKEISEGNNYKAIHIGSFDKLSMHNFVHPRLGHTVNSKVFVGEILKSTGAEISFTELPAKTTISFLHKHKKHEEIYVFIKGYGQYQVDNNVFQIKEGSIVRVSPDGSRTLRNDSENIMIYMVIQSSQGTLAGYDISDGYRIVGELKI